VPQKLNRSDLIGIRVKTRGKSSRHAMVTRHVGKPYELQDQISSGHSVARTSYSNVTPEWVGRKDLIGND